MERSRSSHPFIVLPPQDLDQFCIQLVLRFISRTKKPFSTFLQEKIIEITTVEGLGGVDYSFECIGNVKVNPVIDSFQKLLP